MKILFIGGTGNISTDCAALLQSRGHEIQILTRGRTAVPPGYRPIRADRKDSAGMRTALADARPDVVLNFLGYELSDVECDFELFKGSIQQYIFISSATVYVKPAPKLPVTEETPLGNQWWDYAQKKQACEEWLLERCRKDRFPVTIVRPSHTYSKLWVANPVSSASYTFALRIEQGKPVFVPDDGQILWTLTATSDFAVGFAGLVGNQKAIGEAFHITSDEALTWNQIYAEIAMAVGAKSPKIVQVPTDTICAAAPSLIGNLKGDKSHHGVFDNAKIKGFVPEFQCRKPFRDGVREAVQWLRAHPEQQNLNPEVDALIEKVISSHPS
ncbi:MAG TPA: NAD-dependent epimerase/dehydratase family protein [Candidatus Dormibacteraeota bacterium]|nr:NAD-dependent epimerase/dehydratase family protein [Candidatus Dormibacteraeota bacterium]